MPLAIPAARTLRAVLAAATVGGLAAACTTAPPGQPFDVGNMAYPAPLPQGNLDTVRVSGRLPVDTGSMAYPQPDPAGVVGRTAVTRGGADTGNMAYPAPLPQGNGPTTRIR